MAAAACRRAWDRSATRTWPWVLALGIAALAAVFRSGASAYLPDNRFELYWAPGQRWSKAFTLWDDTRGLGRARDDFWAALSAPVWLFRSLGASPAVAERCLHVVLLVAAGSGMVAVVRALAPETRRWAGAAGFLYAFGPYSAVFLTPSALYVDYALAPWFTVAMLRGCTGTRPWRWAAVTAILVLLAGNTDPPGLLLALVPAVVVLGHGLWVRSIRPRDALRWWIRAAPLSLGAGAAAVTKTALSYQAFTQRLVSTEAFDVAATTSSWTESLRGTGFWVSYIRLGGVLARPQGALLFSNAAIVVATAVPATVALISLWGAAHRSRRLFGVLLALGGLLVVGGHPRDDPSPWGDAWLWAGRNVPGFDTLRSTYKAGSTLWIGVSGLVAIGAFAAAGNETRRRLLGGCTVVLVAAVAVPFWTGHLYDTNGGLHGAIPTYWHDAVDWLDDQPGDGGVLVLPGATRARYRWGDPGDDILDTYLARRHLTDVSIPLTTPMPAAVLEAIDDGVVDRAYQSGTLAPILRRLGVEYVLLRNDLAWRAMDVARPADLSRLRKDSDFVLASSFGTPGENTVGGVDERSRLERALPPIQILRVRGRPVTRAREIDADDWTLLEGDGDGWLSVARSGDLVEGSPLVPPGTLDDATLTERLAAGSPLVVTDTNRRRAVAVKRYEAARSRTLAADEDLGRSVPDLFGSATTQTVAVHPGATRVTDSRETDDAVGTNAVSRASQALDGDLATGWVVPSVPDPVGRTLRIELTRSQRIDGASVIAFDPRAPMRAATGTSFAGVPRVARVAVLLSNGDRHDVNLLTGAGSVRFPPTTVQWVEIRILDTTADRPVGIAEVTLRGSNADLAEYQRVPIDVFRRARHDASLAAALERAPVTYLFARELGPADVPVESQLRRRFETAGRRGYSLTATVSTAEEPASAGCGDRGVRVDGQVVAVRVTTRDADTLGVESCAPVTLGPGLHELHGEGTVVEEVQLRTGVRPVPSGDTAVAVTARADGTRTFQVAGTGRVLVTGDAYDPRWTASLGSADLGDPIMVDAQTAFLLPDRVDGASLVDARFSALGTFRAAVVSTVVTASVCAAILLASVWRWRR